MPAHPKRRRKALKPADELETAVRDTAIRLLARREHSAAELAAKLKQRGFDRGLIDAEVTRLTAEGLQDDVRFAEQFTEERVQRGDGPLKIRSALAERGVAASVSDAALAPFADRWQELAWDALVRRFGSQPATERREWARRMRFLQTRGFPGEVAWSLLSGEPEQ